MKAIKTKSLMSLIYVALLSIPLVSILSRVIYVQSNKNAYQSYSELIVEVNNKITLNNFDNIIYNQQYTLDTSNVNFSATYNQASYFMEFSNANWTIPQNTKYFTVGGSIGHSANYCLTYYDNDKNYISYTSLNSANTYTFVLLSATTTNTSYYTNSLHGGNLETFVLTITTDKLDNVFEYSVSKLVDENNFGELNFFEWFSGFLLNDHQQNMLYVRFANWYLCYAMLISLMQILFLCLMWFVNFSRKLLDRGMNYDW